MKIFTKFLYVNLLSYCFLLPFLASGQTAELRFLPSLDCQNGQFSTTLQIQAASDTVFRLGTSSVLLNYNPAALQFVSYSSLNFDGSDLCVADVAAAWDPHAIDGTSNPGTFNLTIVLNNEGFGCPEINNTEWVDIGTIVFNVQDSTLSPDLAFGRTDTNFNVDDPNDGTEVVRKGNFMGLGGNVLACPANQAPTASFTATPSTGAAPLAVAFDANASTDPDGTIVSYAWDFGDGTTGTGVTANHTYATVGAFTAQLIVTDDSTTSDTFTVDIAVNALNVAPTASFTATPNAGAPPLAVAFDANASTDPDGTIVSYAWDFGDGTTGTGVTANHTYATVGAFTAQLIVTDDSSASDTFTVDIAVNALNVAPTASFTATPNAGAPPLAVAFDANASTDTDGTIVSYAWDFGDGTTGTGVTANHTYATAGAFTAQLIVTDDSTASDTFTVDIAVNALNVAPTASFTATPNAGAPPLAVAFDANASTDPDGTIVSYAWDFGDGNTGTGVTANHTYATAGAGAFTVAVNAMLHRQRALQYPHR